MVRAARIESVGVLEISHCLDVSRETVNAWQRRTRKGELSVPFPLARGLVSGFDAWDWPEVRAWYLEFKTTLTQAQIVRIDERRSAQVGQLVAA